MTIEMTKEHAIAYLMLEMRLTENGAKAAIRWLTGNDAETKLVTKEGCAIKKHVGTNQIGELWQLAKCG